jgi:hypothetical protein
MPFDVPTRSQKIAWPALCHELLKQIMRAKSFEQLLAKIMRLRRSRNFFVFCLHGMTLHFWEKEEKKKEFCPKKAFKSYLFKYFKFNVLSFEFHV